MLNHGFKNAKMNFVKPLFAISIRLPIEIISQSSLKPVPLRIIIFPLLIVEFLSPSSCGLSWAMDIPDSTPLN
jgi:hypothetical protein